MVILLYVDDFCLIASSIDQLLAMIQTTQTWCENNRLTISTKSKVMVFHESRKDRATRDITQWLIRRDFPLSVTPLYIDEVSHFVYIGITVDPTLNYDLHCIRIIRAIQMSTNHLLFARETTPSLRTHSVMILYRLWISTVAVHTLSNLLSLRTMTHLNSLQVSLNASLSRVFGVPTSSVCFLHMELGFPPLLHQCDIALARFHCHLVLAPPHTLHSIIHQSRRLQAPNLNLESLDQCTRTVLIRLGRPHDYDNFVLPQHITRTKTTRPVRTYARSLYPAASTNWRTALFPAPAVPSRHTSYITLFQRDFRRTNLFLPSQWLRRHPFTPVTVKLLQLRAQASFLPTHRHHVLPNPSNPGIPYRTFHLRSCPYCPTITGDETHMFLDCPRLALTLSPTFADFLTLLTGYELHTTPLPAFDYLSLLLAADPSPWIQGLDRLEWLTQIVPFSIAVANTVSHPLPP
jgi:hypothetical protein